MCGGSFLLQWPSWEELLKSFILKFKSLNEVINGEFKNERRRNAFVTRVISSLFFLSFLTKENKYYTQGMTKNPPGKTPFHASKSCRLSMYLSLRLPPFFPTPHRHAHHASLSILILTFSLFSACEKTRASTFLLMITRQFDTAEKLQELCQRTST